MAGTLLVFDMDNTLVHSRIDFRGIRTELIALLHQAGVTAETEEALRPLAIPELILLAAARDGALKTRCWEIVLRHEREGMLAASVEPDAEATLAALDERGYRLALLTNNARPACEVALRRFGLLKYFDVVVTRDDVARLKPQADGVEHARAHFDGGVGRVVVIGDSWIDGLAAQRAGAEFVAFRSDPEALRARGIAPGRVIRQLGELLGAAL